MEKILLVDDDLELLNDRSYVIRELGYDCITASNADDAVHLIESVQPDVILTDLKMPEKNGFDLLKISKEIDPNILIVIITAYGTIELAVKAMKMGAFDFIQKPITPEILEITLKKAFKYRALEKEILVLKKQVQESSELSNVIGRSKAISDVIDRALQVAKSDANVLIYGESGTGKELIARAIHLNSKRRDNPFIPLDCVALPETLLEIEIFGFEQGSFTGADKTKPGMIELADKGTLFLDEISELQVTLQAKLLRVLQERQFRRIGGTQLIDVDMRIISATNRDPEYAVKEKKLRQDLYFRLNVVPIFIPPLRERKEDIPLLIQYFIKRYNPSCEHEIKGISKEAVNCLKSYEWPGNIRELQNIIEQIMSLTRKKIIGTDDLPDRIFKNNHYQFHQNFKLSYKEARENYIRQFSEFYFGKLMSHFKGNLSQVARTADISRKTLYTLLQKYNISRRS